MSDLIKEPYELSIWETTFEENYIINFIPPLSTVYSDEWTVFNKKVSLDTGKTGFWDWISDDVDVSQYDKDWVHFSFLNAKYETDDEYTYEINLDLSEPSKDYTFLIQFRNLIEEKVRQDSTFKINDGQSLEFKDYINDPYVLNLTADTEGKINIKINFTIPWSGQPATFLRGSINSKLSFDIKLGLFEGDLQAFPEPFPLYNEAQGNWIKTEKKIYTIGSDSMTAPIRAINPIVKTNVNGEKTLTFSLYTRFFDEEIGEFRDNPFINHLFNETYLKLYRKNGTPQWEEYIIKNIAENSENKTYTYTAKRASIVELSKSGYNLEFNAELMNNQGTAIELTKQVFAGTDWEVDEIQSDKFWGNSVEPVYEAIIEEIGVFECIRQANIGSLQLYYNSIQKDSLAPKSPTKGQKIYIPYSSYQTRTENGFIQFLWPETGAIEVDEKGIIYNANSYIWHDFSDSNISNITITGQIKGDNLQKRKKTKYIKGINRIVEEGIMDDETCYKITEIDYQTSNSVSELIVNGKDFESTAGWRPVSSSVHINLNTDKDDLSNILNQVGYLVKLQLINNSSKKGLLYNAAIRSNLSVIDNMVQGEEFCLEIGENSSNTENIEEIIVGYQKEDETFERILSFTPQIGTITASCSQSVSNKELASGDIKLYFVLNSNANVLLDKISLFKKIEKETYDPLEEDGFYRPGDNIEAKAITKEIYYNPYYSDNINATSIDEIIPAKNGTFIPNEYEDYVKISSIEVSKSNRFNILQEICEAFECWADLQINHNSDGSISSKKIVLKNYIGNNKNVGFSYGVNLKGVTRNLVSDQIVTKMIVEPNNNENGLNGFSTIARAKNNKSKDNTLYNFDYYINQGSLKAEEVSEDLYVEKGLLYRLGKINNKIASINEKIIAQQMELNYAKSNHTTAKELVEKTQEELIQLKEDFYDRKQTEIEEVIKDEELEDKLEKYEKDSNLRSILINYKIFKNKLEQYETDLTKYSALIDEIEKEIESLQKEIEVRQRDQKSYLNIFTEKYANYIQEGTWTDESYYDDDLYYLDAQNVLYTSAFPKVSYTINVIDVSPLGEEFSPFNFKVGDKTYIEDTEFFGWNATKTSPYKEEVVISETEDHLDSPEQNKITVQNYKTQFEDLFQRIAATTQSLQSAAGAYQRAANKITSTNSIDPETVQNSFLQGIIDLQNMGNMSIKWTSEGVVISNQKDTNNKLRLSNIGIAQSEDGGEVWKTVLLAGRGITANSIVTGTLDANKISIKSGDAATFIWDAKGLRAYETIWIEKDGSSSANVNFNNYIEFNDKGLIAYRNKENGIVNKPFELTAEGNLTLSGSLKVAVLEYGKVQAVGGILLIRPSSLIKKAEYDEANNLTKIWVETPSQFSEGDWCVIGSNLEDIGKGNNATPYKILSIDDEDNSLTFSGNLIETFDDLINLALTSIIDSTTTTVEGITETQENNIGIAINSSTNEAFSNARSFSIFESSIETDENNDSIGTWVRENRLILGQLPEKLLEKYKIPKDFEDSDGTILDGTYGLYADNAIIKGAIYSKSGEIGGWIINDEGIYNNKPDFNANLVKNSDETIQNSDLVINEYDFDESISKDQGPYSLSISLTLPDDPNLTSIYGELDNDGVAENNSPNRCFTIEQKDLLKGNVVYKIPLTLYTENQNNKIKILREKNPTTYTSPMQIRINWIKVEKGNQFTDYTVYNKEDLEKIHLGSLVGFTWGDLYKGKVNESYSSVLWIGGSSSNANFRVTKDGSLHATNATLSGQITATSGIIGKSEDDNTGWRIGEGYITSSWVAMVAVRPDGTEEEIGYLDPIQKAYTGVSLSSGNEAIILTPKWTASADGTGNNVRTYILEKDGFYSCYSKTVNNYAPNIEDMKPFKTFSITSKQIPGEDLFEGNIEVSEVEAIIKYGEEVETLSNIHASTSIRPGVLTFSKLVSSTGRYDQCAIRFDSDSRQHYLTFTDFDESSPTFYADFTNNCFTVSGEKGLSFRLQGSSKINNKIVDVALHIGGGGINHGVWSQTYEKYLIYANGTGEVGFQLPVKFEQDIKGPIKTIEGSIWARGEQNAGNEFQCGVRGATEPSPKIYMYMTNTRDQQNLGITYQKYNGTQGAFLVITNDLVWLNVDKAYVSQLTESKLLKITSTDPANHLEFSRVGTNYITFPGGTDAGIGFYSKDYGIGTQNTALLIKRDSVCSPKNLPLGSTTYPWQSITLSGGSSKGIFFIESGTNEQRTMFEYYKDENNEDTIRIGYGLWEKRGVLPRQSGKTYICASGEIRLYVSNPDYSGDNKTGYVSLIAPNADDFATYLAYFRPGVDNKITLGTTDHRWTKLYAAGGVTQTSDEREKENIFFLNNNTERTSRTFSRAANADELYSQFFDKLAPAYYNFLGDNKISFGLIAQQIVSVLNELGISEDELELISHDFWVDEETGEQKDRYGLIYSHFIPLLIHEVQKLKKRVSELENLQSN